MAGSSQNSVFPSLPPSVDSPERTSSLHPESSLNAAGQSALEAEMSEQQDFCKRDVGSDVDVEAVENRQEDANHSSNVRETEEESNYGDDEKGVSGAETDSVDYGDVESEIMREGGVRDGSVSPSYSSLRVEPDLEDSQSHLRLEEIFEGDGSATESGVNLEDLSEPFAVSELELIERALQSLQKARKHGKREVADSVDGEPDDVEVDERGPPSPDYSRELTGVSRLLKKVQAVRAQKRDALATRRRGSNRGPRPQSISTNGDQDMDSADMRQVVQAASRAALSAAKSAEAMVNAMDRNSQAIEELCKTLTTSSTEERSLGHTEGAGKVNNDENSQLMKLQQSELDIELRQEEITKNLIRQNRLTHWVLGFMIVSTFAWRFGVVKFVKKVNNAVSNPFQGITDVFDNLKGDKKKGKKAAKQNKGLKLPSILHSESDDDKEGIDGELPFKIGNILPRKETDTEIHASAHAHRSEHNSDGPFNIGKILPGRGDSTDDDD
ncbi:hypothetical protein Mapa_008172 [Marchantia paleacea]|nr:hypothetical protein Mapa_008172 [Marchantia paleacea]